ncbi:RND superfamily putative drug exporter [Antricoccus suffuscus]|uniref:RND superfamily putative drug exporter n=1 Tax=Antricoccus suffuscus TaxID=1629062 RepID=A0A2T0Z360_9ACTN|nr:MMPL family transporter [Antricoccus suffuscus]PRZ30781.1 RND superfamily putative drug exporter [Antricoccus suffuscus]
MATLLHRLGRFSLRHRRSVLAVWLVVLIAGAAAALGAQGTFSSTFSIPGMKSQVALDQLEAKLPAAGGTTGQIVVAAPKGKTLAEPDYQKAINAIVDETKPLDKVTTVIAPIPTQSISEDGRIGFIQVMFKGAVTEIPPETQDKIANIAKDHSVDGLQVELGGGAVKQAPAIGSTEGIGVIIALVVLAITFGSMIAAGLPMLTALIGIGVGMTGILTTAAFVDMSDTAPILALMLGLAVGIDYALFIVSKHRDQLRRGMSVDESIPRATGTAGTAVLFAGLTVVIALVGLTVVGIPFLSVMGLGSAATVAIAVLIAVTLVPALLGFAGLKILPKKERAKIAAYVGELRSQEEAVKPNRWIRFVTKRPVAVLALGVIMIGVIAIPAMQLRLGLPNDSTAAPDTTKRKAYDLMAEGFGDGKGNPLIVTVTPDKPLVLDPQTAAGIQAKVQQQIGAELQANPQLADQAENLTKMAVGQAQSTVLLAPYLDKLSSIDNVRSASAVGGAPDGTFFAIQIMPKTGPSDAATETLVHTLRSDLPSLGKDLGAQLEVTGMNVVAIDISQKLADALPVYLAIVVGLALILLLLVFRSILVPLKAVVGFLLTIGASFGAVVAVYQLGWLSAIFGVDTPAPIISFLPVLLIGILFGLSMDYEMFLVSGMRESYAHGATAKNAVIHGFGAGSRVVTAAAIIMISVFAGFILAPDAIIASIGFSLAFGVLVDAFVVRMTLVPAAMYLFDKAAWWLPKWLDKILPNADVEGAALVAKLDQEAAHEDDRELEPV